MGEIVEVIKEVHILFANINRDGRSAKLMNNLVESTDELGKFLSEGRETFQTNAHGHSAAAVERDEENR